MDGRATDNATPADVDANGSGARPLRVPDHIARKLDRRQAEVAERKMRRASSSEDSPAGANGAYGGTQGFGATREDYVAERDYEPAVEVDEEEVRRVEAEREAEQFGAMLETLRELHLAKPGGMAARDGDLLGATAPAREHAENVPGDEETEEEEQLRNSAADQDLVAAGLMSGVAEETDDDLASSSEMSAAALKRRLCAQLGEEVFEEAHARLQCVAEEEDDDVLVADIQRILGADRLDKLPMMLKLIFLEEQQQAS